MANSAMEQQRYKAMLESLQQQDPNIEQIVMYSKFVVAYELHQEGPNPGWQKANIEGPVYLVRRRGAPGSRASPYQVMVKNQFSTNDLVDVLHCDWELDCQKNYVFYKVEDSSERIRGLWFHDDAERLKLEQSLEVVLEEIRRMGPAGAEVNNQKAAHAANEGVPQQRQAAAGDAGGGNTQIDALYAQFGLAKPSDQHASAAAHPPTWGPADPGGQERVVVTRESLRAALHALVDDEAFLNSFMQKLKAAS